MTLFVIFQFIIFCVVAESTIPKIQEIDPVIKLTDLSGGHNVVGEKIELECQTTFYAKYISIEWKTPKHEHYKNVNVSERANSSYVTTSTLVVPKAKTQHSGLYICELIHKQLNYLLATRNMSIKVYGEKDRNVNIKVDSDIFVKNYLELALEIGAHPAVSIKWITDRNKIIENSTNITVSLTPKQKSVLTMLLPLILRENMRLL